VSQVPQPKLLVVGDGDFWRNPVAKSLLSGLARMGFRVEDWRSTRGSLERVKPEEHLLVVTGSGSEDWVEELRHRGCSIPVVFLGSTYVKPRSFNDLPGITFLHPPYNCGAVLVSVMRALGS
jgi:FixJ family two-component response regulator